MTFTGCYKAGNVFPLGGSANTIHGAGCYSWRSTGKKRTWWPKPLTSLQGHRCGNKPNTRKEIISMQNIFSKLLHAYRYRFRSITPLVVLLIPTNTSINTNLSYERDICNFWCPVPLISNKTKLVLFCHENVLSPIHFFKILC